MDSAKVNGPGGAICLGHTFGASGARVLSRDSTACSVNTPLKGLATLCTGGGQGVAMALEGGD